MLGLDKNLLTISIYYLGDNKVGKSDYFNNSGLLCTEFTTALQKSWPLEENTLGFNYLEKEVRPRAEMVRGPGQH
jgi:hypothetical protein